MQLQENIPIMGYFYYIRTCPDIAGLLSLMSDAAIPVSAFLLPMYFRRSRGGNLIS